MKFYENYISKADVEAIHDASLHILSKVGIKFEAEKALDVFRKHGVRVEGDIVYIDEKTFDSALKLVPKTFEVNIAADKKVTVGNHSMFAIIIRHATYISKENKIQKMLASDAIDQFKMSETSTTANLSGLNYAFLNGINVTKEQRILSPLAFVLKYSNKYKLVPDVNVTGCNKEEAYNYVKKGLDIIRQFYGVEKGITMTVNGFNPLSPLCYDATPLSKMMSYIEENQALQIGSCGMPLLTAPASVAGMVAMTNAEALAGIVFAQLYRPGTNVIYGNTSSATDMRTVQLSIGSPEAALVCYATAAMADYYKMPFRTGGGLSDANQFDAQAGAETMMMLETTYETKPDLIYHHLGCLGSFNIVSLEKLILDEEIAEFAQRKLRGIDVTEEKLCLKEIEETGPRGTFLKSRTPKMYREEFYLPKLFNKDDPNNWQNTGAKTQYECAKEIVTKRLASYNPPEITKEQADMIEPYLPDEYKERI